MRTESIFHKPWSENIFSFKIRFAMLRLVFVERNEANEMIDCAASRKQIGIFFVKIKIFRPNIAQNTESTL